MDEIALPLTGIPPEDEALRAEVRAFVESALSGIPADVRARAWMGYDPAFSARPLKRVIQRELGDRIAMSILDGTVSDGDTVVVDAVDGELTITTSTD